MGNDLEYVDAYQHPGSACILMLNSHHRLFRSFLKLMFQVSQLRTQLNLFVNTFLFENLLPQRKLYVPHFVVIRSVVLEK